MTHLRGLKPVQPSWLRHWRQHCNYLVLTVPVFTAFLMIHCWYNLVWSVQSVPQNQMLPYTPYITPKRVTSLRRVISASSRPGNAALLEKIPQWWLAVCNTVSCLTGPRFEPQTSRSRDEGFTARPTKSNFEIKFILCYVYLPLHSSHEILQLIFVHQSFSSAVDRGG